MTPMAHMSTCSVYCGELVKISGATYLHGPEGRDGRERTGVRGATSAHAAAWVARRGTAPRRPASGLEGFPLLQLFREAEIGELDGPVWPRLGQQYVLGLRHATMSHPSLRGGGTRPHRAGGPPSDLGARPHAGGSSQSLPPGCGICRGPPSRSRTPARRACAAARNAAGQHRYTSPPCWGRRRATSAPAGQSPRTARPRGSAPSRGNTEKPRR